MQRILSIRVANVYLINESKALKEIQFHIGSQVRKIKAYAIDANIELTVKNDKTFQICLIGEEDQLLAEAEEEIVWLEKLGGKGTKTSIYMSHQGDEVGFIDVQISLYKVKGQFELSIAHLQLNKIKEGKTYSCLVRSGIQQYKTFQLHINGNQLQVNDNFIIRLVNLEKDLQISVLENEQLLCSCQTSIGDILMQNQPLMRPLISRSEGEVGNISIIAIFGQH